MSLGLHILHFPPIASVWLYGFIFFFSVTTMLVFILSLIHIHDLLHLFVDLYLALLPFHFLISLCCCFILFACCPCIYFCLLVCWLSDLYLIFSPCPMTSLPFLLLFVYLFIPFTFSPLPLLPFSSFICLPPALLVCLCYLSLYYCVAVSYASLLSVCLFQISQILILTSTKSLTPLLKYQSDT